MIKSQVIEYDTILSMITNKSLGQHFLFDRTILTEIVNFAGADPDGTVLEIGPGLGTLTSVLLKKFNHVVAIEYDADLADKLPAQFPGRENNLTIFNADFLQFNLNQLPANYHVVANIPYYITAKIVRKLLTAENKPKTITLLVQKEVAERLAAEPGDLSILAISAQVYSRVTLGPIVGKNWFTPPPKVDSQVVKMELYDQNLVADLNEDEFFRLVKIGFSSPRKKVLRNLAGGLHENPNKIREIFVQLNIAENTRAEDLTIDQWNKLCYNIQHEISAEQES